ncbi:trypsin-like serine protease [Winogradskyella pacifica]|uniref:trypsin-like serine protease n=1 Tax=Winogradskyella pacifica TaxID=664642 RepID=UPI0015CB43F9|nr:trypsin-like serine protease [Winogradskyella pacifica]
MFNSTLTSLVYQINCGTKNGTAFLITKNFALTVYHVVSEHKSQDIKLSQNDKLIVKAKIISDDIEESKVKDFAILELEEEVLNVSFLCLANSTNIKPGTKWTSRGYPKSKMDTGENMYQDDNTVHQHLSYLKSRKIDIELNHNLKWSSYEGISGAPLIIDDKIIGIINSELIEKQKSKELCALSIRYLEKILKEKCEIIINSEIRSKEIDIVAETSYEELIPNDKRNLPEKLKESCTTISDNWINLYCREHASGKLEIERYTDQEIRSIKFVVFEVCQFELLKFVDSNINKELTLEQIEGLINKFIKKGNKAIKDKSSQYRYVANNKTFMRKIVLDLINDCFLSFDKNGIYG